MKTRTSQSAFTLLELLTVIAIIGILAAVTLPNLGRFKPNVMAAASRQLLDDIARARQLAIAQRTTVYMVFVPPAFWSQPAYGSLNAAEKQKADKLLEKQMTGYTLVTLRSLGDQPGAPTVRYLSAWKTLPDGAFLAPSKFRRWLPPASLPAFDPAVTNGVGQVLPYLSFLAITNTVPFPSADGPRVGWYLPYLAFNYMGQVVDASGQPLGYNPLLPLALGSVGYARSPDTKLPLAALPTLSESPAGNGTNAFNIVNIDWLTGRARVERLEVQ